ncbi:MEDS domain-containing protein [Micromonospora sp. NPDC049497]|uniref:MEDS domain-containing protein n=1 Tax=Micromonospora sp. NPDC049497 TaxID=3364273 RepID=UPI003791C663
MRSPRTCERARRHVCWAYDDLESFAVESERYLLDGLASGEQVWYVTARPDDAVSTRLRRLPAFADALARGSAEVVPLASTYTSGGVVTASAQIAAYADATAAALAAGYTGLRVVADATELVRTPAQLDAFCRYEHRIDRWMHTRPFRAMCAYDRARLGPAVAELACLHPVANVEEPQFRLFAVPPGEGHAEVAGEVDADNRHLFRTALDRADLHPDDGELVLRAGDLSFLDHRALVTLDEYARRRGATAVLRTSRSAVARLVALLSLSSVRVEVGP